MSDSSGEGQIFRLSQQGELGKLYKQPTAERASKLEVMLRNPPDTAAQGGGSIAWPAAVLKRNGRIEGFSMPEIADAKRPVILYTPKTRQKDAPGIDWFSLHVAALNVARVCKSVHDRGYVIGDLKAENWMIDQRMTAAVIDTDSFQIKDPANGRLYRCPVGTPDYTPHELFGRDFTKLDRTVEHDSFAVGVLIYQFLLSKHPFSGGEWKGRGPSPSETSERILKGQWLWGGEFRSKLLDIPLDALAPELVALMRRCFDEGHKNPRHRPMAAEWVAGLEAALDSLTWCNTAAMHVYSGHRKQCTWCELSKATRYDPFPTQSNIRSRSLDIAIGRFRHAHQTDLVRALRMVDRNPRLAKMRDLAPLVRDVEAVRKDVRAIEEFRTELNQPAETRNNMKLIEQLDKNPRLIDLLRKSGTINADTLDQLDRLRDAVRALKAAIAASPENRDKAYALAGERAIAAILDRQKDVLLPSATVGNAFRDRTTAARQRVCAHDLLTKALSDGDDEAVANIAEEFQASLATLVEARALRADVEARVRRVKTIREFITLAAAGADDARLVQLWEGVPGLSDCSLARKAAPPLANRTPLARYELARRRVDQSHVVASVIKDCDSRSGGRIVEAHEREILAAWETAEKTAGASLAKVGGGSLATRVRAGQDPLGHLWRAASAGRPAAPERRRACPLLARDR